MRTEDKQFLDEHAKRIDERHQALITYLTTEFQRVSKHLSKQNDRLSAAEFETLKLGKEISSARWAQKHPTLSILIAILVVSVMITLIDVVGVIDLIKIVK